jgi:hypothetical protein
LNPLRQLQTTEAVEANDGERPEANTSASRSPTTKTRTTSPQRHPAPSTPNRRNDRDVGFAGMPFSCTSANRETVEKHGARAKTPPLLSTPSRAAEATVRGWELRVPRLHRSKLRSKRETSAPRPAAFASPVPTPCRQSERGAGLGAASTSDLGRTEVGRQEQLPRSCTASPGLPPRRRSKRGIDLGAGSASDPGRAGDGHPIRNPRSCKERSSPPRGELALLGLLAWQGYTPKRIASLGLGLNR